MFISERFEELQGSNLEFLQVTAKSVDRTHFETMFAILDFSKRLYLNCLKSYKAIIQNISPLPPNILSRSILDTMFSMFGLLLKRRPKAPRRAPSPPKELEGGAQTVHSNRKINI